MPGDTITARARSLSRPARRIETKTSSRQDISDWSSTPLGAATEHAADGALARYHRARRTEFAGKWIVERLIGAAVGWAPAMNYFSRTLAARKDMADLLVGVTGDFVPPREVLRARYLLRLLLPA